MPKINTLKDVFVTKLQVLLDIETELENTLPKLREAAESEELKEAFSSHLEETMEHRERIGRIFELIDIKPKKLESEGIRGIIKDGSWVIKVDASEKIKDAMLASAARYAEHFEMAGYLSAIMEASALELDEVVDILTETLEEEEAADEKLSEIINDNLSELAEDGEEESDDMDDKVDEE
jgi:ferritin-like metal-binding protein YciE